MTDDQKWMRLALNLARRGLGQTSPNPNVGAVIVKNGTLLGKGYHRQFGGPHAEVFALREAGEAARGATLYVTLEPCSHYGKTPPCVNRVIKAGISRVVIATPDPNPLVNGRGIRKLQQAGIAVTVGVEGEKARQLNEPFFTFMETGLPFVRLKIAQTLDGKIATPTGDSRWITGEASRRLVHRWRAQMDAVLVGIGTVLKDNPALTVRMVRGRNPRRVILDPGLRVPLSARVVSDGEAARTILFTAAANRQKISALQGKGVTVFQIEKKADGHFDLKQVLEKLTELGIISVLVEGGSGVFSSFLNQKAFHRLAVFQAPKIAGSGLGPFDGIGFQKMEEAIPLKLLKQRKIGEDGLFEFKQIA
ncbi:MAG: bifunctional diaminohydroxyphosphoribosylaminopyrimidine deaminase/5-amino-6-(5-phosphoribosylamino)uracil reductase RibD [Calditrichaeota bacterium]|nr:bifunctional diaminohydroxyphosphoribosylaminopyrimidine deaminase/5-amino-6-(5-phosphoribosylamino)uracil reductase RibD [Calditrichota bacterium]